MSVTAQQIPESWENLTFDQAIEPVTDEGKRVDRSDYLSEGSLPVIDQGEERIGGYTNDASKRYNGPLPVIVFGDHTRRVKLVDFPFVVGAQGVKLLKPKDCWEPRFLAYLLPTLPLQNRGYGRHYQYLRQLRFLCPPKSHQRAIVAEIEKQFTRLEAGVAGLRRVQANLKRYRAAVLKAACEGKLVPTEAELARQEGRTYETGAQLLERIITERRKKWSGRGQYREPAAPDTANLLPASEGWTVASIDQLAASTMIGLDRGRAQQSGDVASGVPYIKMNNVTMDGRVLCDDLVYVPASRDEATRFAVQDGDILFNTRNSKELVGKVGMVRTPPAGAIYNNNLMRIRLAGGVSPAFLALQMCSHEFRRRMELVKKATTNVAAVYAKDLLPLTIALPPLAEQTRIVADVERHLSVVEELESVVNANLQRATRLRQSILHRAFTG